MAVERMLPSTIDSEKAVLGSIIIDPEAFSLVADFLKPEHFTREAHRVIYETMLSLYEKQEPADFITILECLERSNKIKAASCEDLEAGSYLTGLINCVPTSGNVEYYARHVTNAALRRRLIHVGSQIVTLAYNDTDAQAALEQSEQLIYAVNQEQSTSDFSSDSEILDDLVSELMTSETVAEGSIIGVPTGFDLVDFYLGGLQKGDLIVPAGRPGTGKSSFMLSIIYNGIEQFDRKYAIFSLEMSKKQLMQRYLSMDTGIETHRIRNRQIRDWEWDQLVAARDKAKGSLWIDDTAGISISALRSKARRLHAQHGFDVLVVDYIQLMTGSDSSKKENNRVKEIGEITMGLKNLAKELDVPVIALAQLSREVEKRAIKIPQLSDLRESGSIENDADVVLFIYRDDMYNPNSNRAGLADIIIAKHRNGPVGEVALRFIKEQTKFENLDQPAPPRNDTVISTLEPYYNDDEL